MTETNYQIALKYYSYGTVKQKLSSLMANFFGSPQIQK